MAKRRFVWSPADDCLVEVAPDYEQDPREGQQHLWNDRSYEGLRATDGTDISSRSKHRAYMKLNNLTTADDFTQTWAKGQQARDEYRTGKRGSVSREDIGRAIHQLEQKQRK